MVKETIFRQKKCVLIFHPKNHSQTIFSFFSLFLTFLIDFQFLCCLAVIVVSEKVLFDLGRFDTTLIKNQFFFLKEVFVMVFGHKNHFQAVFSFLQQTLTFSPAFQFSCCLTVLVVCERVLID